jgi:(1->4)-alpha-D-glucan 1-alpha-D-glucosylmutase
VDYQLRRELLTRVDEGWVPPVDGTGAAKLLVVSRALRHRRDHPDAFAGYTPVEATGPAADCVVAFDRGGVVTVATRRPVHLSETGWGDTALQLPTGAWRDLLTGTRVVSAAGGAPVGELLAQLPVGLFVRD